MSLKPGAAQPTSPDDEALGSLDKTWMLKEVPAVVSFLLESFYSVSCPLVCLDLLSFWFTISKIKELDARFSRILSDFPLLCLVM